MNIQLFFWFLFCGIDLSKSGCFRKLEDHETFDPAFRDYYVDQFKTSFLKELNMRSPPRINENIKNSLIGQLRSMGQVVDDGREECMQNDNDENRKKREIIMLEEPQPQILERIIAASVPGGNPRNDSHIDSSKSYFNLEHLQVPAQAIARATINLLLVVNDTEQNVDLRIYKYIDEDTIAAQPVFDQIVKVDSDKRVYADVTELVQKWVLYPTKNYGLLIKAEINERSVMNRSMEEAINENILLHIEFSSSPNPPLGDVVSQRAEQLCSHEQPNRNCCRYPLEVTLDQVGLGFVISPKRINIFYCTGECPFGHLLTSRHAHMMQQASSVFADDESAPNLGPCCVPTEFQNLTVLYMPNDYSVKESVISRIIALRCGCS